MWHPVAGVQPAQPSAACCWKLAVPGSSVFCDAGLDCGCCWLRRHSEQSPQRWFVVETRRVTRVCCREPRRPTKAGAPQLVQRCGRQCRPGLAGLPARQWAPLPRGERAPAAGGVSRRIWLGNARGGRSAAELSDRGAGSPSNGSRLVRAGGASLRPLLPYMSCLFYSRAIVACCVFLDAGLLPHAPSPRTLPSQAPARHRLHVCAAMLTSALQVLLTCRTLTAQPTPRALQSVDSASSFAT